MVKITNSEVSLCALFSGLLSRLPSSFQNSCQHLFFNYCFYFLTSLLLLLLLLLLVIMTPFIINTNCICRFVKEP